MSEQLQSEPRVSAAMPENDMPASESTRNGLTVVDAYHDSYQPGHYQRFEVWTGEDGVSLDLATQQDAIIECGEGNYYLLQEGKYIYHVNGVVNRYHTNGVAGPQNYDGFILDENETPPAIVFGDSWDLNEPTQPVTRVILANNYATDVVPEGEHYGGANPLYALWETINQATTPVEAVEAPEVVEALPQAEPFLPKREHKFEGRVVKGAEGVRVELATNRPVQTADGGTEIVSEIRRHDVQLNAADETVEPAVEEETVVLRDERARFDWKASLQKARETIKDAPYSVMAKATLALNGLKVSREQAQGAEADKRRKALKWALGALAASGLYYAGHKLGHPTSANASTYLPPHHLSHGLSDVLPGNLGHDLKPATSQVTSAAHEAVKTHGHIHAQLHSFKVQPGDNPWTISRQVLHAQGVAYPHPGAIAAEDQRIQLLNHLNLQTSKEVAVGTDLLV